MATDITGIPEVQNALLRFQSKVNASAERALRRCGLLAVREAKANAPRSPTKSQFSATLVRKKRTSRRRFTPGGLEKSIEYEVQGDRCSVFVSRNSFAGKYAAKIHDERNKTWWDRGPGTIAKGQQAREKFIERAITDNQDKFLSIIESEIGKAIQ